MALTKCDNCRLAKTPIIYLRSSCKLCMKCWQNERETAKSLVNNLPNIVDKEPPLGYSFIVNDYFSDNKKGRLYADWVFASLQAALS